MGGLLGALGVGQGGGSSGPNHSKQSPFHPSTPLGKLPKAKTSSVRAHTSSVRATAAVASVGNTRTARRVTAHAASGGLYTAPELAALWIKAGGNPAHADMAAAVALAESSGDPNAGQTHPYHGLWQIGPGGPWDPLANAKEAVRKSFNGTNWNAWTTVTGYDTPGHVPTYTQFLGRSGYSTSSTGGATAPITLPGSKKARPKITTVGLERGQSGVSKGLGSSVLKGGGTWGRKAHKVTTSFSAALTSGQVADLAADPATNPKARQMRLFAVASRINQITSALTSGRVKSQATKDRLLDELKGLYGERDDLLKPIASDPTGHRRDPRRRRVPRPARPAEPPRPRSPQTPATIIASPGRSSLRRAEHLRLREGTRLQRRRHRRRRAEPEDRARQRRPGRPGHDRAHRPDARR
jgi:hypothetical protein